MKLVAAAAAGATLAVLARDWWPRPLRALADTAGCYGQWALAAWDWATGRVREKEG